MADKRDFSRRGFFQTAASTAAVPMAGKPAEAAAAAGFDLTKQSAALQADRVVDSACQFCNSLCRLKVQVKSGRIAGVKGEPADPVQAGGLCVKGETMMTQLAYNGRRLTRPLVRVRG
jgi:anaerobic selenocysteine-containing dehydrogenase